jgi:cytochrome c556
MAEDAPSPKATIEARRAGFKRMGAALKSIMEQLKAETLVPAKLVAPAEVIATGATAHRAWFPSGSGSEAGVETDALPQIWQDRAKFDSFGDQLVTEAQALTAAVAAADPAVIGAQARRVAAACAACHRSFRAD